MKRENADLSEVFEKIKKNNNYMKYFLKKIKSLDRKSEKNILEKLKNYIIENELDNLYPWIQKSLGKFFLKEGNFIESEKCFTAALEKFQETENNIGILKTVSILMNTKFMLKKYEEVASLAMDGINIAKEIKCTECLEILKFDIASVYIILGEFEKALEIYYELESFYIFTEEEYRLKYYNNRIICEIETKNFEEAEKHLDMIKEEAAKIPEMCIKWKMHYDEICVHKGKYEQADKIFEKNLQLCKNTNNFELLAEITLYHTPSLFKQKKYKESLESLKNVEDEILKFDILDEVQLIYKYISTAYKELKDYKNAYIYLKKHLHVKEKLQKVKSNTVNMIFDKTTEHAAKENYKILYMRNQMLLKVGQNIMSNLKKEIFHIISEQMKTIMKYDCLRFMSYDKKIGSLKEEFAIKHGQEVLKKDYIKETDKIINYVLYNEDICITSLQQEYLKYTDDINECYEKSYIKEKLKSEVIVKIKTKGNITGILCLQSTEENTYTLEDFISLKILSIFLGIALENSRLYQEVDMYANFDDLTGLYNRRRLMKEINKIWKKTDKNSEHYEGILDIDNFKKINDKYGHIEGDKVLKGVAEVLKSNLKENCIAGRYGGEEFLIVLTQKEDFKAFFEKIRNDIENLNIYSEKGERIKVTASIGVIKINYLEKTVESNISAADECLYKAKNSGKNKVIYKI